MADPVRYGTDASVLYGVARIDQALSSAPDFGRNGEGKRPSGIISTLSASRR
jgi:hypothetical protein